MSKATSSNITKKTKTKVVKIPSVAFSYLDNIVAKQTAAFYAIYNIQPTNKSKTTKKSIKTTTADSIVLEKTE